MTKLYRISDRIRLKVDGLVFVISPLSFAQKAEIQVLAASGDLRQGLEAARMAVKHAVKDVEGLCDHEGQKYNLELSEGAVSDSCLDDLFNIPENEKLAFACLNLLHSVPDKFVDPHTGDALSGVELVKESTGKKKKA